MAFFKYMGEPPRSYVSSYGKTTRLAVPKKDGSKTVINKPEGFAIGAVIDYDFTDQMSLMFLRSDTRFQEVA